MAVMWREKGTLVRGGVLRRQVERDQREEGLAGWRW